MTESSAGMTGFDPRFNPAFQPGYDPDVHGQAASSSGELHSRSETDPGELLPTTQVPAASGASPVLPPVSAVPPATAVPPVSAVSPVVFPAPSVVRAATPVVFSEPALSDKPAVSGGSAAPEKDRTEAPAGRLRMRDPFIVALWALSLVFIASGFVILGLTRGSLESLTRTGGGGGSFDFYLLTTVSAAAPMLIVLGLATGTGTLFLLSARRRARPSTE